MHVVRVLPYSTPRQRVIENRMNLKKAVATNGQHAACMTGTIRCNDSTKSHRTPQGVEMEHSEMRGTRPTQKFYRKTSHGAIPSCAPRAYRANYHTRAHFRRLPHARRPLARVPVANPRESPASSLPSARRHHRPRRQPLAAPSPAVPPARSLRPRTMPGRFPTRGHAPCAFAAPASVAIRARPHVLARRAAVPCARARNVPRATVATRAKRARPGVGASGVAWVVTVVAAAALVPADVTVAEAVVRAFGGDGGAWRSLGRRAAERIVGVPRECDVEALRGELYAAGRERDVDVVLQEERVVREGKSLAIFDLDSTLISQETINELALELQVGDKVAAITSRAMNGEIGFEEALAERVKLLRGLPLTALDSVKERVQFTPGAIELIRTLSALGCETAVVSGGFHFLADHVRDVLGLDYSFANRLEHANGVLTGTTIGEVVDGKYKERTLQRLADERNLRREQVLAVGDGSNDLLMMASAGLGVAFNAKPVVQNRAKCRVNQPSLTSVLYLLGLSDHDIAELVLPTVV